jgi:NADH-quinone oxidoreductase subunit L
VSSANFLAHAFLALPVYLAGLGVCTAYLFFLRRPELADAAERKFKWLYTILVDKYGFDWFNEHVIVAAARLLGGGLWRFGDQLVIDDGLVNGSARTVGWLGSVMRYAQSGYLYHYAFAMILGLASFLLWILWRT